MKNLFIAGTAMLAFTACGVEKTASEKIADIAQTIETDKNLGTLTKAEAELSTIIDDANKIIDEANNAKSSATAAIGSAFLTKNAAASDVITTDTGLQYKVIQPGIENGASAAPGQGIAAHYHGYFIDDEVFDSSYSRGQPLQGPSNGFIKGWNEALGNMKVCEARTLYINSDLAYGDNGRGGVPGGATLIFNMQLLAVQKLDETEATYECPEEKILTGPEAY